MSSSAPAMARGSTVAGPLEEIFRRVRSSQIEFNAQDVYQVCATALNMDTIGMMSDPDFMRGLSSAFQRSDQTVLSPFQVNLVTDVFAKVQINISPKDIAVPTEDEVSPEALLNVLKAMTINKKRDEIKLKQTIELMTPMLEEFTPSLLAQVIQELSKLKCTDTAFMGKVAKRACEVSDDLSPLDISTMAMGLCYCQGVPHMMLIRVFRLVEARCGEFQPEDFINVLYGLNAAGPKFTRTLGVLAEKALEKVETLDANTLANFIVCFTSLDYKVRAHVEIFADALVEVIEDLNEKDTVQALIALVRQQMLTPQTWNIVGGHLMHFTHTMDPRNIAPVMDMCSQLPFESDLLMKNLLDRAADLTRIFSTWQLGEILDIIALYPPAREHKIVQLFGKQSRLRIDLLGPTPLANCCRGLANLGYNEQGFYLEACETFFRYGFKDFAMLEPILQGLCIDAGVNALTVKILGSYMIPMAPQMSLQEIERANRYMNRLGCEDDMVFKALADRVRVFVRDVTPDMPEDLQVLLARGAAADAAMPIS